LVGRTKAITSESSITTEMEFVHCAVGAEYLNVMLVNVSLGIELDAETKESTRRTEEKLDGRYKEGHE
jgi:hypothetical protein